MSQYALDRDEEDRLYEGPDQEPVEAVATFISVLVDICTLALFIGMAAIWAAVGSGRI